MNVPGLRFKEFSGDWCENNLLALSENGFSNGVFNDPSKVGTGYKLVNVIDMYIDSVINENTLPLIELSEAEFLKNKVEYGDVFFTRSSLVKEGIAYSNVYLNNSDDVTFDGHLVRMRPKKELIHSMFLNYMLKTSKVRCQLVMRGKTATMTTIGQADIATVVVSYPYFPEQNKIANFLTAVDQKIAQLTQKGELLARYKKGVMQQIFSQKLRFKDNDGQGFPEWEQISLGKITLKNYQGINTTADNIKYENNGFPIIQAKHITNEYLDFTDSRLVSKADYLRYKEKYSPEKYDLLISNIGTLGKVVLVEHQIDFLIAWNIFKVTLNMNICNPKYILHYLKHVAEKGIFESLKTGNATKFINKSDMLNIQVDFPAIQEQTKIANFLTALDDKINHNQTQLDAVKQYKQGLLQQLFV